LSSAILYLAIIAIWACVLIPRWLKRDSSQAKAAKAAQDLTAGEPADVDPDSDAGPEGGDVHMTHEDDDGGRVVAADQARAAAEAGAGPVDPPGLAEHEPAGREEPARSQRADPQGHTRILSARRRMLIVLAALTTVALAIVLIGLAAWWVVIPPVVMLGGYLLLLREARHADADRAFILANAEHRDAQRRLDEARVAARQREEAQSARVIHIAARVRDEIYDQYADGERRAVGD
jgi:hypothetical protein